MSNCDTKVTSSNGSPASDGPSGGAQLQLSRKATGGRALVIGPRQCPLEHGLGDWSGRPTTWSGYGLPPDHQFTRRTSQPINDPHFTLTVTTFRARTCSLAELEDQTGHPAAAADTLEWVIDLDRYAEEPYRRLMALHASHGRGTRLLRPPLSNHAQPRGSLGRRCARRP
jgi:hypothetical protein